MNNSQRCEVSEDLIPYKKFFRAVDEPKYDFSRLIKVRKRKPCQNFRRMLVCTCITNSNYVLSVKQYLGFYICKRA